MPQKSLADGPAHPRSTFCHSKVHYSDVKETFHGSVACLTRPSRSASPGWVTFCVRCNQLQPLSVQLRCLDAQPNRSQRARNARSNGEETRLNRHLARRPALSTSRRHLIHQFHSCARRCATTLLKGVKTTWTTRGDQVLNRWVFIFAESIYFLGQTMR